MCRRCGERDRRGNAADRRARKHWLLTAYGDGATAACTWCEKPLNFVTVQQDRLVPGGPYRRDNVVPACADCNIRREAASIPDGCFYGRVDEPADTTTAAAVPVGAGPDPLRRLEGDPERKKAVGIPSGKNVSSTRGGVSAPRVGGTPVAGQQTAAVTAGASANSSFDHLSTEGHPDMHSTRAHHDSGRHHRTPGGRHRTADRTIRPEQAGVPTPRESAEVVTEADAATRTDAPPARDDAALLATAARDGDLVVIDTTNLAQLREQHPWLFTDRTATDARLDDAEARLDRAEDQDLEAGRAEQVARWQAEDAAAADAAVAERTAARDLDRGRS